MKVEVDFNQALLDINDKPLRSSDPDEKQARELQRLSLVANHSDSSLEEAQDALKALQDLREATMAENLLGEACVNALASPDDKADGKQVTSRMMLAQKIQGSPEAEEFCTVSLNDKTRKMLTECLERLYAKQSPLVYWRCDVLINGDDDEEEEEED